MDETSGHAAVEPHTQYVRTRLQCPGCGERVPAERHGADGDGSLCSRCRHAR